MYFVKNIRTNKLVVTSPASEWCITVIQIYITLAPSPFSIPLANPVEHLNIDIPRFCLDLGTTVWGGKGRDEKGEVIIGGNIKYVRGRVCCKDKNMRVECTGGKRVASLEFTVSLLIFKKPLSINNKLHISFENSSNVFWPKNFHVILNKQK